MYYKIIDNFLPVDELKKIQQLCFGEPQIEWTFNDHVNRPGSEEPYDFQFTHTFFWQGNENNTLFLLRPILEILNPSALVRIKANLQTRTPEIIVNGYHYDHPAYDGKIAIFYVNTNNGYTMFDDGTMIESIENRMLIFNGNISHTGTTCTDQKVRCVINFMFYQWTDSKI